jgi:hypothetical protein
VETPLRKYVARVTRSVRGEDVTVTLEPDDTESLEDLLTSPAGAGPAGTSERQAAFERKVTAPARSVFSATDNDARFDRSQGVWKPAAGGTGKVNTGTLDVPSNGTVDLGGGSITNTGGGAVDVGTGAGIGGSGSLDETIDDRVAALLAAGANITITYDDVANTLTIAGASTGAPVGARYWVGSADATLTNESNLGALGSGLLKQTVASGIATPALAVAGTDYVAPGSLNESIDDRVAALLAAGAGITLTYDDAGNTLTIATNLTAADVSAAPDNAKYIVQQASSGLSAEQALSALATGLLKNTTSTGVLSIATGSDLPSHTHTSSQITDFAEAVDDEVAGLLVAGSGITLTYNDTAGTLTIAASGGISGSGASGRLTYWNGSSALTSNAGLTFDGELHAPGRIYAEGGSAGVVLDDRDGSGHWLLYVDGNGFYVSSTLTGGTNLLGVTSVAITPASGSGVDLGSGGNKFATMYGTTLNLGGNQVVGSRRTGWSLPSGTVSRATFVTGTATVTDVAQRLAALLNDLSTHGLIGS